MEYDGIWWNMMEYDGICMYMYVHVRVFVYTYMHMEDVYTYIWSRPPSLHPPPSPPPHGLGPQVAAPLPFYLQAIGSISEVQLRIC